MSNINGEQAVAIIKTVSEAINSNTPPPVVTPEPWYNVVTIIVGSAVLLLGAIGAFIVKVRGKKK